MPVLLLGLAACDNTEELFPPNATLAIGLVDSALTSQLAVPVGNQFATWVVEEATNTVLTDEFAYVLDPIPCGHAQRGPLVPNSSIVLRCGEIGYVVPAGGSSFPAETSLTISYMDLRRAEVIDLPPDEDFDLDGVVNQEDNCALVPNPGQEDSNGDGFGDACSIVDSSGTAAIPDRDADGVSDLVDNCLWIFNPFQLDLPAAIPGTSIFVVDGIGDVCAETATVLIPIPVTLDRGPEQLVPLERRAVVTQLDFGQAVSCDPQFTVCALDPAAVVFSVVIP